MSGSSPLALVSLKSFGDFVIARWALRRVVGDRHVALVAAEHLRELDAALGPLDDPRWVAHGEGDVPAAFDLRRRGWLQGGLSAWRLRQAIARLDLDRATTLVFDKVGARERFIAGRRSTDALPPADNIYLAYEQLLCLPTQTRPRTRADVARTSTELVAGIFPGSRVAAKALPVDLINALVESCANCGVVARIFALEGEATSLPPGSPDVRRLPRRFDAMVQGVRSVHVVISADSMPAHLAEFFGLPVFVLSPVPNPYWLPLSCFAMGRSSSFETVHAAASLASFLADLEEITGVA